MDVPANLKFPRFRRLLSFLKSGLRTIAGTFKYIFAGSIVFIFIPQLFMHAEVGPRLNANIYDFYGFLILVWLSYKSFILSRDIKEIKENTVNHEFKEQIVADAGREIDMARLKKLKKKLDKRRKK
jgi:hypothetical protein